MYVEDINFALWCDFVERDFLEGEFRELLANKTINGATSNPAIFQSSFKSSPAYLEQKTALQGKAKKEIYETMAKQDIATAAIIMDGNYMSIDDGFISIEVDPFLCDDAKGTIEEGKKLFAEIGKENVMIKVPATKAGYEAMEALMSDGINVNATLIFSTEQAKKCAQAMQRGIQACASAKKPQGVVSVFVSRFDRKVDPILMQNGMNEGQIGIMNAMACYYEVESVGERNVRTLFASTGVKGDSLPASHYCDALILPHSVNTAPLATIKAFVEGGVKSESKLASKYEIAEYFVKVENAGIDMDVVCDELLTEGLEAFKVSFNDMLDALVDI